MTTIPKIPSLRPEPRRDDWGRYLLPDPETGHERSWTRSTFAAGMLIDDRDINAWKCRMVAEGLALMPDLLQEIAECAAQIKAAGDDWRAAKAPKKRLNQLCEQAAEAAGSKEGSELGTAIHALAERLDLGRINEIEVPERFVADLAAYQATMTAYGYGCPKEYVERVVVNTTLDLAGTFDRLLTGPWDGLRIGDVKSQQSIDHGYLEISVQLALYAHSDFMEDPPNSGRLVPMPEVDKNVGVIMHVPAGKGVCEIHEVNLTEAWEYAQETRPIRRARARTKALGRRVPPPTAKPAETGDRLLYLINNAAHPDALTGLYRAAHAEGRWTDAHTAAARARKARLAESAEKAS